NIGPAPSRESYLKSDIILDAARRAGAASVHPGYGFLSENAGFAQAVMDAVLIWIGPAPASICEMGDKERASDIGRAAGVPILPGSGRLDGGDDVALLNAAQEIGFPLLVKAAAGGGGIGMRRVDSPEKLLDVARATQSMAEKSF